MAYEPTREELIIEARTREQLGPERQNQGKRNRQVKSREKPHWHEIKAASLFGVTALPAPGRTWPEDSFNAYFNDREAYQWPGKRGLGYFWHRPGEPMFTVRVLCSPVRRSDEWLPVEHVATGQLYVIPYDRLYFLDGDAQL